LGDYDSVNGPGGSLLAKAGASIRSTIPVWGATLEQVGAVAATTQTNGAVEEPIESSLMEFLDDTWLTDIFASWEAQY
jgi:hypothetical protein